MTFPISLTFAMYEALLGILYFNVNVLHEFGLINWGGK